jgi:hypothetical protein
LLGGGYKRRRRNHDRRDHPGGEPGAERVLSG